MEWKLWDERDLTRLSNKPIESTRHKSVHFYSIRASITALRKRSIKTTRISVSSTGIIVTESRTSNSDQKC